MNIIELWIENIDIFVQGEEWQRLRIALKDIAFYVLLSFLYSLHIPRPPGKRYMEQDNDPAIIQYSNVASQAILRSYIKSIPRKERKLL